MIKQYWTFLSILKTHEQPKGLQASCMPDYQVHDTAYDWSTTHKLNHAIPNVHVHQYTNTTYTLSEYTHYFSAHTVHVHLVET